MIHSMFGEWLLNETHCCRVHISLTHYTVSLYTLYNEFRYEWKDDRSIEIIGIERDRERSRKGGAVQKRGSDNSKDDDELQTCRVAKRFQKR